MGFFKKLFLSLLFLLLISIPQKVKAQEFKSDYKVEYFLKQGDKSVETDVRFSIKLTNLEKEVYVSKFTLAFPKSFEVNNLTALDDKGNVKPNIVQEADRTRIELEFSEPQTGIGSQNNFYLNFKQRNLFKINGNVWEVILPTVTTNENEKYQVVVHLPSGTNKKISISKPVPDLIQGDSIYWNNPKTRTIYAIFGDAQIYKVKLNYNLVNPKFGPVYSDIALPPDTTYQKVYLSNLNHKPDKVFIDEDGNYLARYNLAPREKKKIVFEGFIELSTQYRPELKEIENLRLQKQNSFLLSESRYWRLTNFKTYQNLKDPRDIHNFLVNTFKYNFDRVDRNIERLGAEKALKSPQLAVCTEFSDSFVALAREKGFKSREIQGYGFSQEDRLRPLSLDADILHSWPQYYDEQKQLWVSIDPTWENTSGIDYFSSLDLNHITFAIHGKRPDLPLPAGSYKQEDTKDVAVVATIEQPQETRKIKLSDLKVNNSINNNQTYQGSFKVKNEGNVFIYNLPLILDAQNIAISEKEIKIDAVAPYEEREVKFTYQALGNQNINSTIKISTLYTDPLIKDVRILPLTLILIVGVVIVAATGIFIYLKFVLRRF